MMQFNWQILAKSVDFFAHPQSFYVSYVLINALTDKVSPYLSFPRLNKNLMLPYFVIVKNKKIIQYFKFRITHAISDSISSSLFF